MPNKNEAQVKDYFVTLVQYRLKPEVVQAAYDADTRFHSNVPPGAANNSLRAAPWGMDESSSTLFQDPFLMPIAQVYRPRRGPDVSYGPSGAANNFFAAAPREIVGSTLHSFANTTPRAPMRSIGAVDRKTEEHAFTPGGSMPTISTQWTDYQLNMFDKYLAHFGTNWAAIRKGMGINSEVEVRQQFDRLVNGDQYSYWAQLARVADAYCKQSRVFGPEPRATKRDLDKCGACMRERYFCVRPAYASEKNPHGKCTLRLRKGLICRPVDSTDIQRLERRDMVNRQARRVKDNPDLFPQPPPLDTEALDFTYSADD
ncbi:hypothetical protein M011DRAFT_69091 [Sporormia fimetaria CBS 119925]|uniref:Myb-like domain-containing protein n=1 Tax=Sporormia fimetaria CBS 119925 TaxID=1340428 RepID=A0A6A6VCM5_9PLEO|nr:hypothetical protein M011DRAFT_69091 [Sporormia fimetaria CBS 119925]